MGMQRRAISAIWFAYEQTITSAVFNHLEVILLVVFIIVVVACLSQIMPLVRLA